MKCQQIMKREVECITADDGLQTAAQRMRDENIGFMPVCDVQGKVIGTLTDRDIVVRCVAEGSLADACVSDAMTHEVVCCSPEDDVRAAERLMSEHQKSRIMCIDDAGKLCGVISLSDIAQHDSGGRAGRTLREVTQREAHV